MKKSRGGKASAGVPRAKKAVAREEAGSPKAAEHPAFLWRDVPRVTRVLAGLNLAGMIVNDLWPQVARDIFALDPVRLVLHQFVTVGFLSFGFVPFLVNGIMILLVGGAVERAMGPVRTIGLYLGSAVLGAIGYMSLSALEWAAGPLAGSGVAVAGLLGAMAYLLMQVWDENPPRLMGRWECGWSEVGGLILLHSGVALLFWITGLYAMCTGTVVVSYGFGLAGGMVVAAVMDWAGRKLLPSPPGGSRRPVRPAPTPPFPKEAAVHPFSNTAVTEPAFVHETTETVPKKKEPGVAAPSVVAAALPPDKPVAPIQAIQPLPAIKPAPAVQAAPPAVSVEATDSALPAMPGPPSMSPADPQVKAVVREIDACNPAQAFRLYCDWLVGDPDRCLDAANQWRLAQLMISAGNNEASIKVMKRLLARHPRSFWTAQARADLGFLYSRMAGRRYDAIEQLVAALHTQGSGDDNSPQPLSPQMTDRVRGALRDLGHGVKPEKTIATVPPVGDKVPETSDMAKKRPPPTGPAPNSEPSQPQADSYSNIFGNPEATSNFVPMDLGEDGPPKVAKMYGGDPSGEAAPKPGSPPPLPGAGRSGPAAPPPLPKSSDEDPFALPDQSGVFKQALWDDPSKKKKEIAYRPPEGPGLNLDESKPIVFDDSPTPGPRSGAEGSRRGTTNVFGSPEGTGAQAPPDWHNVAETGSVVQSPGDIVPPEPGPGVNSSPFWNRSSPFVFPDDGPKKKSAPEDRFITPPPSASNAQGSGEKARPLKKRETKSKDDDDFFPTPQPFTAKPAAEEPVNKEAAPAKPGIAAKSEDRYVTPPPRAHEHGAPKIAHSHGAMPLTSPFQPPPEPPPVSMPDSSPATPGGTDVWSAFLKEDRVWPERPAPAPPVSPPAPPPRAAGPPPVAQPERMIHDSAPTVQRPAARPQPPPAKPGAEIEFAGSSPDQTMVWSRQYAKDRDITFSPSSRYSIIIAPSSVVMIREIIGILRGHLGMNEEAALFALKHRHGILASGVALDEAVELCNRFAERGQGVALIEEDDRLVFGEPQDVMRVKMEEKTARLFTMAAAHTRKWKELVGVGCGRVILHPGAPGRDVLDLYYAEPGLNLRLWRDTLMSAPPVFTGKMDNETEFHALAKELVKRAPHAIQTQSFIEWTQGTAPDMTLEFSNLVEYQNYSRWYLMAHYGRSKLFGAGKKR